jgi:hypothetical protein
MTNQIEGITETQQVITPVVANYIQRYNTFLTKTIENILELGKVIFEADKTLMGPDRQAFFDAIKMHDKDSTYKKLKQIGSAYDALVVHKECLPGNWTTIYKLASIVGPRLKALIDDKIITPNVTMGEINQHLSVLDGNLDSKEASVTFGIKLNEKNKLQMFQIKQGMEELAQKLGLKFEAPTSATYKAWEKELTEFKQAA